MTITRLPVCLMFVLNIQKIDSIHLEKKSYKITYVGSDITDPFIYEKGQTIGKQVKLNKNKNL